MLLTEFQNIKLLQEIDLLEKQYFATWIIKFSHDCCYLSITGTGGGIFIYNMAKVSKLFMSSSPEIILHGHKGIVTDLSWSREGNLISSSLDETVLLWKATIEQPICVYPHNMPVTACRFLINNPQFFITACKDNLLRLFHIDSAKPLGFYQVSMLVNCLEIEPEGHFLAVGLGKGEVWIYIIRDDCKLRLLNSVICRNKRGVYSNGRKVNSLNFIDSELLLVSTADSRIRVVKYKEGTTLHKFKGHKNFGSPIPVEYSFENNCIMTGSEDGKILFWKINSKIAKSNFYESIEVRNKRPAEYSVFAPNKIIDYVNSRYIDEVTLIIFTIGAKDTLKVLFLSKNDSSPFINHP